ncbi:MAG: Asp-tRNA(Asn)/Glu-tRNA(Gln) amidotransferase subunit GatC [Candidatus Paceibacterota bacterium]
MNIKDVENLAELARIELSLEEKTALLKDIGGILEYVDQIKEAKIGEVEPARNLRNIWREDKIEERDFSKELIKEQFPDAQDDFLKVKKIL